MTYQCIKVMDFSMIRNKKYANFSAVIAVKPKVYVTVQVLDAKALNDRRRSDSTDKAGTYVCCFSSSNVTSNHVHATVHREGHRRTFRAKIPRSKYTARNGFEGRIKRFIQTNDDMTFVAPSYHTNRRNGRHHITDTQLYVSGGVEDSDESHEEAARREIMEEIGLDVSSIKMVATFNGDTWFHATVG